MKPEEIKLGDWARFFFGETPPSFFIEVVIRALVVFLLLIISMRLLGKRMAGSNHAARNRCAFFAGGGYWRALAGARQGLVAGSGYSHRGGDGGQGRGPVGV